MKVYVLFVVFNLLPCLLLAQSHYQDVVYLKNGSIIRGVIIEQVPNQNIKIETADKSVFVFKIDEIEKITKELVEKRSWAVNTTIRAGLNLSYIHASELYVSGLYPADVHRFSKNTETKHSFIAGATINFQRHNILSLESGLFLSGKGYIINDYYEANITDEVGSFLGPSLVRYQEEHSLLYLELPVYLKASFTLNRSSIYSRFGPYLATGLSGKVRKTMTIDDPDINHILNQDNWKDEYSIKWGSGSRDNVKRLDFGLGFGAGAKLNSILIDISYSLGLLNIAPNYYINRVRIREAVPGHFINNRVLTLSAGYVF